MRQMVIVIFKIHFIHLWNFKKINKNYCGKKTKDTSKTIGLSYMESVQCDQKYNIYSLGNSVKCHCPEIKLVYGWNPQQTVRSQRHWISRNWNDAAVAATVLAASLRHDSAMDIHNENVSLRQVDDTWLKLWATRCKKSAGKTYVFERLGLCLWVSVSMSHHPSQPPAPQRN